SHPCFTPGLKQLQESTISLVRSIYNLPLTSTCSLNLAKCIRGILTQCRSLILYLLDSSPEQGGALEIRAKRSHGLERPVAYLPRSGDLLLMDGTRCYYRIMPLRQAHVR